ncbi:MAG: NAD(P)-binding domain-containing protein [Verrucomicrobiae bacterium]|nr:NAD(P)-binding domain-containing protein [Verrucomicrobiae bacterium]
MEKSAKQNEEEQMYHRGIGFVGGGRVTRIFLHGWKYAGSMPARVTVYDCSGETLGKLKDRFPNIEIAVGIDAAAGQDVVFLAVHPPVMCDVCSAVRAHLKPDAIVVSLAPKFTVAKLAELLGGVSRVARVIPNAPSVIGQGYNPIAFGPALSIQDRSYIKQLLEPLGDCPEVSEEKLEAYAILTGMGPTYLWFQLQTLREVVSGLGLSDAEIVPAMKRMVCGATRTLLESGLTPGEVMDLIPVKPLAEMEAQVTDMYRTRLSTIYQKIKP